MTENKPSDAILARLSISQWTGRKADKAVTAELHAQKHASDQAGKYVKNLIDPKALTGINSAANEIRRMHNDLTRPWDDGGRRLLPGLMIPEYKERIMLRTSDFQDEVDKFCLIYPELRDGAREWLGDLYDETDYPFPEAMPGYFKINSLYEPIPSGSAIPMTLRDREEMAQKIEAQSREIMAESAQALFFRVKNTVLGLQSRLMAYQDKLDSGSKTSFHKSVLDEVRNVAALLPALNIENDPFLNGVAERLQASLAAEEASALKDNAPARKAAIEEAGAILRELEDHG